MDQDNGTLPAAVIDFWQDAGPTRWFRSDPAFDEAIRERFLDATEAARTGQFDDWAQTPQGALALLILLDQFSRNLFRRTPRAFAADAKARGVADAAIARRFDMAVKPSLRQFFYTPFMHSEILADQERSVALYTMLHADSADESLRHAQEHRDIIARFGRFPHRNPVLGRVMHPDEQAYLDAGGFSA